MIRYSCQNINDDDISEVTDTLRSEFLTQGPKGLAFEVAVRDYCNARFALSFNSATSALHAACLSLDIGPGDVVWTSPNSFVASANCAKYCGAKVDFVDIDSTTFNISVEKLKQKLIDSETNGTLPKALVVVHFAGQSCDMARITELRQRYGFKIIEDASHALGGSYQNQIIGSCQSSDIAIFSFHPVKMITCGEGGMATTNDHKIAQKLELVRGHGITRNSDLFISKATPPWHYEMISLGFNYRMTDIQSSLGFSQLKRLESFVRKRRELSAVYDSELKDVEGIKTPQDDTKCYSSKHLYPILIEESFGCSKEKLFEGLKRKGITTSVHYPPIHLQPFYQREGFKNGDFPNSEEYYQKTLSIPLYVDLTETQQDLVIQTIKKIRNKRIAS